MLLAAEGAAGADRIVEDSTELKYPFKTAKDLLRHCVTHHLSISQVMMANESAWRPEAETRSGLLNICSTARWPKPIARPTP